jgi:hypothetical protein
MVSTRSFPVCTKRCGERRRPGRVRAGTIERDIVAAVDAFKMTDPAASVPSLALRVIGDARRCPSAGSDPDVSSCSM